MKRVGAPAVSPDGKWVVFSVTEPAYDEKKEVADLWIVARRRQRAAAAAHVVEGRRERRRPGARTAGGSRSRPSARTTRWRRST